MISSLLLKKQASAATVTWANKWKESMDVKEKSCCFSVRGLPGWALRSSFGYSGQETHMSEALSKHWLLWPSCYFCFFPVHALSFLSHTRALEGWPRIIKACHTTGQEHLLHGKGTRRHKTCFYLRWPLNNCTYVCYQVQSIVFKDSDEVLALLINS